MIYNEKIDLDITNMEHAREEALLRVARLEEYIAALRTISEILKEAEA